jgi:hypothetical protein
MPLEASHPVVEFLRRLEEKGLIDVRFWSTLPRDESEVARALDQASKKADALGVWDRRRLQHYLNLFDPQRKREGTRLRRQDSSFILHGSVEYFTRVSHTDSIPRVHADGNFNPQADLRAFGSLTPAVQATYRDWAYLTTSATVGMERSYHPRFGAENYLPAQGLPYNAAREGVAASSSKVITFDAFRMVVGIGTEELRLEGGQDWNEWGPGHWQHATLGTRPHFWVTDSLRADPGTGFNGSNGSGDYRSGYRYPGEGPPMPQLRLRFGSDHWEYVKIVAQRTGLWKDSAAALVAHRVQFRAGNWRFGATEMQVIGSRETDWLMFLPALPLKVIEHEGGNRDNTALSADVEWILRGHGRVYGEFFLDDFSGLPLDYWGNKFAWTLGGVWHDPFGLPSEVRAEYSRVDPWVYGHHLRGTQIQHYGALLGSSLPPNSHAANASIAFPLLESITVTTEYGFRQRDLRSPGSSVFDSKNEALYGLYKKFLSENVEERHHARFDLLWNFRRFVTLNGGAGWLHVDNWRGNPGVTLSTPTAFAEVSLRY